MASASSVSASEQKGQLLFNLLCLSDTRETTTILSHRISSGDPYKLLPVEALEKAVAHTKATELDFPHDCAFTLWIEPCPYFEILSLPVFKNDLAYLQRACQDLISHLASTLPNNLAIGITKLNMLDALVQVTHSLDDSARQLIEYHLHFRTAHALMTFLPGGYRPELNMRLQNNGTDLFPKWTLPEMLEALEKYYQDFGELSVKNFISHNPFLFCLSLYLPCFANNESYLEDAVTVCTTMFHDASVGIKPLLKMCSSRSILSLSRYSAAQIAEEVAASEAAAAETVGKSEPVLRAVTSTYATSAHPFATATNKLQAVKITETELDL